MTTSDNNANGTIILEYLQQAADDMQHKLASLEQLTPAVVATTLHDLTSNFQRAFPSESSSLITEASVTDLLAGFMERRQKSTTAASTGMPQLDRILGGGLQAGRLIGLLGAPGSGKTSLANQIADRVAEDHPVLYVTSEDTSDVLLAKTISRRGNIDYGAVLKGSRDHANVIEKAMMGLAARSRNGHLRYVDATAGYLSLHDLRERAKRHFTDKEGPCLLIVDYLQKMARGTRSGRGELREAVSELTDALRQIACDLQCTVVALSSMHRASGYGKSENGKNNDSSALSASKESGDIEYCLDVLAAIYEDNRQVDASYLKPRTLRVDKNRCGPVTTIPLLWYADRQEFRVEDRGVV